jgi:4'-phosphopantetheinyl transferase
MSANFAPRGELPSDNQIDVWAVPLSSTVEESARWERVLSSDEQLRAARFRFARDAIRFRHCHAALRVLLGGYLNVSPWELEFTTSVQGKPQLLAESPLRFNLAHSENLAVMAFGIIGEVGIDVEKVAGVKFGERIAANYFTSEEADLVRQETSADMRARTFLRLWTRKEAVLKAVGCGLTLPLNSVNVAHSDIVAVRAGPDGGIESRWRVQELPLTPEFVGSVAAPQGNWSIHQRSLSSEAFAACFS